MDTDDGRPFFDLLRNGDHLLLPFCNVSTILLRKTSSRENIRPPENPFLVSSYSVIKSLVIGIHHSPIDHSPFTIHHLPFTINQDIYFAGCKSGIFSFCAPPPATSVGRPAPKKHSVVFCFVVGEDVPPPGSLEQRL